MSAIDAGAAAQPRVAVLGLGRMGDPIARRLLEAYGELTVWTRNLSRAREFADARPDGSRVHVAETPSAAAASADVVVTMLADGDALIAVVDGPEGVRAGARPGTVVVDMGTSGPAAIAVIADTLGQVGVDVVDAPVSGSVAAAETGTLLVMVGGSDRARSVAAPVLDHLSRRIVDVGPSGSAAVLKLCVNALLVTLNSGIAEALLLAQKAGISREIAYDVFTDSAAGAPFLTYKRRAFLEPGVPVAFSLDLVAKDVALARELAESLSQDVAVLDAVATHVARAREAGRGGEDMSGLAWPVV